MKKSKTLLYLILMCLIPMVAGVIVYNRLPMELPIHFNTMGVADNYAHKAFTVFGLPLFFIFIMLIVYFGVKYDPKNHNQNSIMVKMPLYFIALLENVIILIVYMIGMGMDIDITLIIMFMTIILFFMVGNYLPKCRQNYTIGIKVPWTLNSERNWNMTHRLAGYIWVISSIIMMIMLLVIPMNIFFIIFLIIVANMVMAPIIYSFILYRKGI